MGRQSRYIEYPFNQGLDTKTDERLVQPPNLVQCDNAVFTDGFIGKRNGTDQLSNTIFGGGSLSGLEKIYTRAGNLVVSDSSGNLYEYAEANDEWKLVVGQYTPVRLSQQGLSGQTEMDFTSFTGFRSTCVSAETSDIVVVCTVDQGNASASYAVYDKDSLTVLLAPTDVDSSSSINSLQCIGTSTHCVIVYGDHAGNEVYTKAISSSDLTPSRVASTNADFGGQNELGCDYHSSSDGIVFAYNRTSSAGVRVGYIDNDGSWGGSEYDADATDTKIFSASENRIAVVCHPDNGDYTFIGSYESGSGDVDFFMADTSLSGTYQMVLGTAVTIEAAVATNWHPAITAVFLDSTDNVDIFYTDRLTLNTGFDTRVKKATYDGTSETTAPAEFITHAGIASAKPFTSDGAASSSYYFWALYDSETDNTSPLTSSFFQSALFLVDQDGSTVGRVLPSQCAPNKNGPPIVYETSNGSGRFGVIKRDPVTLGIDETKTVSTALISVDYSPSALGSAEYNGSLYLGGAQVFQYDGESVYEAGFHLVPEAVSIVDETLSGSGNNTNLVGGSTYTWYFVFETTDANGNRLQSAPRIVQFDPDDITGFSEGVDDTPTFEIEHLSFTQKTGKISVAVYATEANGVIPYRIGEVDNSTDTDLLTFTDDADRNDTDFIRGEVLYTASGALGNVSPFSSTIMLDHDDRIFYVDDTDRNKVYFSKRPGASEQPGFNEGLYIQAPQDGDEITGLAVLDGKLVIFKRDRVYMVSGEGPNNLGLGPIYSVPRLVSTDVGCKDARSIVRMPAGIMFQSDKGIYLLNRGESVSYIGRGVEGFNDETITSAVLVADANEVRFTAQSGTGMLVLNYEEGVRWSTFNLASRGAVVYNQVVHFIASTPTRVRYEEPGDFRDLTSEQQVTVETAWLKPAGTLGRFNVRRLALLGYFDANADVEIDVYVDYSDSLSYNISHTPSQDDYRMSHMLDIQRVNSIKFVITNNPTSSNTDFKLQSLALEIASLDNITKLPSGNKT